MNRRGFFSALGTVSVGLIIAPNLFLPKLDHTRWKRTKQMLIVPNPEYQNAIYEMAFISALHNFAQQYVPYPARWNELDASGQPIYIPPCKTIFA